MAHRRLDFSHSFGICSGTVTVDLACAKVLLIRWQKTGEYLLPKGHKDIGETLERTALRETFEETGHHVQLLPLHIKTLATAPASLHGGENEKTRENGNTEPVTEPIAVQQRVRDDGALKIIFWFVARGDSTEAEKERPPQEGEEFDTVWVSVGDVAATLSWEDDRKIVDEVVRAVRCEGLLPSA